MGWMRRGWKKGKRKSENVDKEKRRFEWRGKEGVR